MTLVRTYVGSEEFDTQRPGWLACCMSKVPPGYLLSAANVLGYFLPVDDNLFATTNTVVRNLKFSPMPSLAASRTRIESISIPKSSVGQARSF